MAYDTVMLKHECLCGNNSMHPENPDRLHAILSRLHDKRLISQCEVSYGNINNFIINLVVVLIKSTTALDLVILLVNCIVATSEN